VQTAVSVATNTKPDMQTFRILQNVSGVFRPGTVTLLVGPPGGGKSMLMKALCGAAPVATTGSIAYNGQGLDEFNVVRTARYVGQHDLHNPALTVRETLLFSAMCQGPGYKPGASRLNTL
jgi:ABC-type multidrug transport system ATPase subunit